MLARAGYVQPVERFATADNITVAGYDFGGDGPPLLLGHATGCHARVWLPAVEFLRGRFHCYGVDSRGHGDSDAALGGNYDWHGLALDALAVAKGFGLDRPYGGGHSSGAALMLLAEEAEPGTFAGLALYEPIAAATDQPRPPERGGRLAAGARRRRAKFASVDEAIAHYTGKGPFVSFTDAALRAYVEHGVAQQDDGGVRLKCEPEAEARIYEMAMSHDAYARLDRVRCPVTFLAGEFDSPMPLAVLATFAGRLGSQGRAMQLDGLDHFGPMAAPERVARVMTEQLLGPDR